MKHPMHFKRWIIWSLAVLFYFYEYFLRVAPSVMVDELRTAFNIGAGAFGTMVAFYLYAYAPMQLPVGLLMDRFGARKLLTLATIGCGLASLLFGFSSHLFLADFSRLIMGAGSAFAFIGMVYITSHWFSGKTLALLVGIGNSIGMFGAVFGQGPLSSIVKVISWRPTMVLLGLVGLLLGVIIYLAVRNDPSSKKEKKVRSSSSSSLFKHLKIVGCNSQTWINGIVALCFYTATVAYGGLWAIPFLTKAHNMTNSEASYASSMIYIGWIIAGPIIGYFSDKLCNRKIFIIILTFLSIIFFLLINYLVPLPKIVVFSLMLILGICLSGQLLCYSLSIELNPRKSKGTALALTNCLVFLGGSFIQTLIGWLLDFNWQGVVENGIRIYSYQNFQTSLLPFPIAFAIAFVFAFFIKEPSKSRHKHESFQT